MTTRVTVNPAGHAIEVAIHQGGTVAKQVLEPGSGEHTIWIYQGCSVAICELAPANQETAP